MTLGEVLLPDLFETVFLLLFDGRGKLKRARPGGAFGVSRVDGATRCPRHTVRTVLQKLRLSRLIFADAQHLGSLSLLAGVSYPVSIDVLTGVQRLRLPGSETSYLWKGLD